MLATDPRALLAVQDPSRDDVLAIARTAAEQRAVLVAHPDTLDELRAALVPWGPMCSRTTLAGALRAAEVLVDVRALPSVPAGLVVLAGR